MKRKKKIVEIVMFEDTVKCILNYTPKISFDFFINKKEYIIDICNRNNEILSAKISSINRNSFNICIIHTIDKKSKNVENKTFNITEIIDENNKLKNMSKLMSNIILTLMSLYELNKEFNVLIKQNVLNDREIFFANEEVIQEKTSYPQLEITKEQLDLLPTFKLNIETKNLITTKVSKDEVYEWELKFPFEKLVININENDYYCHFEEERGTLRLVHYKNFIEMSAINVFLGDTNRVEAILSSNLQEIIKDDKEKYNDYIMDTILTVYYIMYYSFFYKTFITPKKESKNKKTKENTTKDYTGIRRTSNITIPKTVILLSSDEVRKSRKKKRPSFYHTATWVRAGYYRKYVDKKTGKEKLKYIQSTVCTRNPKLLSKYSYENVTNKKYTFPLKKVKDAVKYNKKDEV